MLGFFISGHPLERFRAEVELFGAAPRARSASGASSRSSLARVVTAVKRQISKKTGKEYARLTLEDFHGTAEAIVFPDAWAQLNQTESRPTSPCCSPAATAARPGRGSAAVRRRGGPPARGAAAAGAVRGRDRSSGPESRSRPDADAATLAVRRSRRTPASRRRSILQWSDGNGERGRGSRSRR